MNPFETVCRLIQCSLPAAMAGTIAFAGSLALAADSPSLSLWTGSSATAVREAITEKPAVFAPESGSWELSRYDSLYFQLRNPTRQTLTVRARAENPGSSGLTDNVRTATMLEPGESKTIRLHLTRRPEDPTYAPFKPFFMYYSGVTVRDNTVDPAAIARVVVWLDHAGPGQKVVVEAITAQGAGVPAPVPFFPFVDQYGQYIHADWPDKIYSDEDFAARLSEEKKEQAAHPGPDDWNQWGGWKNGPKQKATGFFYPKKVDGKWWLVDPEGCLFFSYGATGVGAGGEATPITGKERWFARLPSPGSPFEKYFGTGSGARFMFYQDGKAWRSFSFGDANAERKFGPKWREDAADLMHSRLRSWGLNTMANWSSSGVYLRHKTPYAVDIRSGGPGGPQLEHIPDVFDPRWIKSVNDRMDQERNRTAGDPWNLGYFVDNEWTWGDEARAARVTHGAIRAAAGTSSKEVLLKDLTAKYGAIAALNTAWGTRYESWTALANSRTLPNPRTAQFNQDAGDFGEKFAEKYFSTVHDAVKRVAPNNLYLGVRFNGGIHKSLIQLAARYCDVISYNIYEPPTRRLNQYLGVDAPFIVGEFGVSSDPEQTPWRGQGRAADSEARIRTLEDHLAEAFVHPALVGAHFFQFRDQPLTGRADGEATLRGFVNVADTPHFDLVQANRRIAYKLYDTRSTGRAVTRWSNLPIRGRIGVGTWVTQAEFKDFKVSKDGKVIWTSDFSKGMQEWSTRDGQWQITDGALRQTGNGANARAFAGDPDWTDYTLTLKARKLGGSEGFLVTFGSTQPDVTSWCNFGGWNNTHHGVESPGFSLKLVPGRIEINRWYELKVEVRGSTVRGYLDGALVLEAAR